MTSLPTVGVKPFPDVSGLGFSAPFRPVPSGQDSEAIFAARCDVGMGVFARRDLTTGERLLAFTGPLIDFAETKRRGPRECMALQIGPDCYIDTQPPGVFVNHSCAPNAGVWADRYLVALRPIHQGEEIRFDYSTTMQEQSFKMACLCGAPECRGMVSDFSTLPVLIRERYLAQGLVMSFIQRQNLGQDRRSLIP